MGGAHGSSHLLSACRGSIPRSHLAVRLRVDYNFSTIIKYPVGTMVKNRTAFKVAIMLTLGLTLVSLAYQHRDSAVACARFNCDRGAGFPLPFLVPSGSAFTTERVLQPLALLVDLGVWLSVSLVIVLLARAVSRKYGSRPSPTTLEDSSRRPDLQR